MASNIYKVSDMVWQCLMIHPETRSDDRELILAVYSDFYGIFNQPFFKVMDRKDLPSFETIRRCRQKLQADDETLRAVPEVEDIRIARQEEFIEYAKGDQI